MEAEKPVETLDDAVLESNVKTIGKTHRIVKFEELNHTLTDTPVNAKTGRKGRQTGQ